MSIQFISLFAQLFINTFINDLPGEQFRKDIINKPHQVDGAFWSPATVTPFTNHKLVHLNEPLLEEILGLQITKELSISFFNGLILSSMPYAHNYAGHQFGYFVKQLGDGRAASLGEVINQNGRWELQLKGSGKTAYSRQGDGRAVLRSSIREYLGSTAMESLGVPTTQAIVIITTTDTTKRDQFYDGNVIDEPLAMVLRVAPNFIRFGSFERFFYDQRFDLVEKLANYSIYHFFPQFINMENRYELFYKEVANLTATMIAYWQAIGFAHGVMNTDNMSILGITIDYGPFQFLDNYDEDWVPNTSDDEGRYAFGKQPSVAGWNLEKLGKALSPLFQSRTDEIIASALSDYVTYFNLRYYKIMKDKLGLHTDIEDDDILIQDLLKVLKGTDYSIFFRRLSTIKKLEDNDFSDIEHILELTPSTFYKQMEQWLMRYKLRLNYESHTNDQRKTLMDNINPRYTLRNWIAQIAINKAEEGNYEEIDTLMHLLKDPFSKQPYSNDPKYSKYSSLPPQWSQSLRCSCSS